MDQPADHDIIRGLGQGRREAWLALYDAYSSRVWRSVARLVGGEPADIADVVQETFLAAARSCHTFDPARGTLWSWLWGISRNQVRLHHRKRRRQQAEALPVISDELRNWIASGEHEPPAVLESRELARLVRAVLAELPDDYSLVLVAKYVEGLSVEQVARQAGLSGAAVMSRLARARKAFREGLLQAYGADPGARGTNGFIEEGP